MMHGYEESKRDLNAAEERPLKKGLSDEQVQEKRKQFGFNEVVTKERSAVLQFMSYFM